MSDKAPDPATNGKVVTRVSAKQVRAARFRVVRDRAWGRATPARIERLAWVLLPGDAR